MNHQKVRKKDSGLWSKILPPPVSGVEFELRRHKDLEIPFVEVEDRLNLSFESDLEVGKKEKFQF